MINISCSGSLMPMVTITKHSFTRHTRKAVCSCSTNLTVAIAMQRCLAWDWLERLPNSTQLSGYGHSTSVASDTEKNAIRDALDDNEYFWSERLR